MVVKTGSEVWVFDRERGRLLNTVQVGRHPVGIAAVDGNRA